MKKRKGIEIRKVSKQMFVLVHVSCCCARALVKTNTTRKQSRLWRKLTPNKHGTNTHELGGDVTFTDVSTHETP